MVSNRSYTASTPSDIVAGGAAAFSGVTAYANSNDVAYSTKGTGSFIAEVAIAQTETSTTPMVVAYDIQRNLNVDIDGTVKKVAELKRQGAEAKTR